MASFVQPGGTTYAIRNNTSYLVYGNSILTTKELMAHWYQGLVLASAIASFVAAACLSGVRNHSAKRWTNGTRLATVAITAWVTKQYNIIFCRPCWTRYPKCSDLIYESEDLDATIHEVLDETSLPVEKEQGRAYCDSPADFESTKSFGFCLLPQLQELNTLPFDLCIIDISSDCRLLQDYALQLRRTPPGENTINSTITRAPSKIYGAVNLDNVTQNDMTDKNLVHLSRSLKYLRKDHVCTGIVLRISSQTDLDRLTSLLEYLQLVHIPVLVESDPENFILHQLNFKKIAGILFTNATIFPNGQRKDFFRMKRLRVCLGRCTRQRKTRPGFLVGFLESWNSAPSSAVIRRAFKLAEFFGAVIQVGLQIATGGGRVTDGDHKVPLSAFDFLKSPEVVELQKAWSDQQRTSSLNNKNRTSITKLDTRRLHPLIPLVDEMLRPQPLPMELAKHDLDTFPLVSSPSYVMNACPISDFWARFPHEKLVFTPGCFGLSAKVLQSDFDYVVSTQRRLKSLELLNVISESEIVDFCKTLKDLSHVSFHKEILDDLIDGLQLGRIVVLRGMDSGFRLPDNDGQFWGVAETIITGNKSQTTIYISQKSSTVLGTILHTYMAHCGISRGVRFEEELKLVQLNDSMLQLPPSLMVELRNATTAELLLILQRITDSNTKDSMSVAVRQFAIDLLTDQESRSAWQQFHSRKCIDASIRIRDVLASRLVHYARNGAKELPLLDEITKLSEIIESKIGDALFRADRTLLEQFSGVLREAYEITNESDRTEPNTELYGLIFFCALRKLAFENVYLETTDRCPFYLSQPDQAAVFAELWVLGSQCEKYFGVLPRSLGEVIYNTYREHLLNHPPEADSWNSKDVFTAYSESSPSNQSDKDFGSPALGIGSGGSGVQHEAFTDKPEAPRGIRHRLAKLTSLAIFCVPAIVDICLLTFLGRGFYLTAFMDTECRLLANYALLASLVLTSGVTGWVGSTGGFYLYSYAFDNLVFFVVERLAGGFMLTVVVAVIGFVAFSFEYSVLSAFVFAAYLIALTTFLNLLGVMATLHREDLPLSSGRVALAQCMCVLFASPIISTFLNDHDILIYLIVVYCFLLILILRFRCLCHEWTSFMEHIPEIKEKDIREWYTATQISRTPVSNIVVVSDSTSIPSSKIRLALIQEVNRERTRMKSWWALFNQPSKNSLVYKLAAAYDISMWLLRKESGVEALPETYSTTWIIQLDLALANQRQLIKGLTQHSAFISFRYSKYDLGQNVGLFLVALVDHWVALAMSAKEPELLVYFDARSRYGIALGLLYFLVGSIGVDVILQRYWVTVTASSQSKLANIAQLVEVMKNDTETKKKQWKSAMMELLVIELSTFGFCTVILWLLVDNHQSIITYFLYVTGYTGVIAFQFNRCFTSSPQHHILIVFFSAVVGFALGLPHSGAMPVSFITYPIAWNAAAASAAFGTLFLVRLKPRTEDLSIVDQRKHSTDNKSIATSLEGKSPSSPEHISTLWERSFKGSGEEYIKTNSRLLQDLCLGIDVNAEWHVLPEDVRMAITCRVVGKPFRLTSQLKQWLDKNSTSLSTWDQKIHSRHEESTRQNANSVSVVHVEPVENSSYDLNFEISLNRSVKGVLVRSYDAVIEHISTVVKWIAIISAGAPDAGRELWFTLRQSKFRKSVLWSCLRVWMVCFYLRTLCLQFFILKGKQHVSEILRLVNLGSSRALSKTVIEVEIFGKTLTGHISKDEQGRLVIRICHGSSTSSSSKSIGLALYDRQYRLMSYHTYEESGQLTKSTSIYSYDADDSPQRRWPVSKTINDETGTTSCTYDRYGRVIEGTLTRMDKKFRFSFVYRQHPVGSHEIITATYYCLQSDCPSAFTVFWCVAPKNAKWIEKWVPSEKITRFVKTFEGRTLDTSWEYQHKRDPKLSTTVIEADGSRAFHHDTSQAVEDEYGFCQKPQNLSFDLEDLLIYHSRRSLNSIFDSTPWNVVANCAPLFKVIPWKYFPRSSKIVYRGMSTPELRTKLWTSWTRCNDFDAVSACILDELILRKEPLLQEYWRLRDYGQFNTAIEHLNEHLEQIVSVIEPSNDASQSCPLLIKPADLYTMGLGRDANQITARPDDCYRDTHNRTSVIFSDNGCWPDAPGGVSNCRRDVVDGHETIRNHALTESANDYGIPRYQIERHVNSVKILPLWGLDGKTPYHGLFDNLLQTQVDDKIAETCIELDIRTTFLPLLKKFVYGARCKRLNRDIILECSNAILRIHRFFEFKDYNKTWNSEVVLRAWMEAWLTPYDDSNVTNPAEYFELERPSISDFKEVLNLYVCYFFIYSVSLPERCPTVFQSTHHGVSSLFGLILKTRKGSVWGIWDHAILWRETCLNISTAQCLLPIPVQSMLLAGIRLACHMAYTHADIILPCTSVFNPDWEMDLGTDQGRRSSKKLFARKIDPIVNGIGNMDAFQIVERCTSDKPTTIMLSNIQFIKDVKNAVLAADIIVNQFGFTEYRLKVYGAQDRQPSYALETETIITRRKLGNNVFLAGFGKPAQVLQEAWLFVNSSLSEGLPLAIGEAALAGIPIVATEVGATALVLTDPDDSSIRYGEVVPPNDPESLARAQLSLLAMLGQWTKYCKDYDGTSIPLPFAFTAENRSWIVKRMYEKCEDRRALGLKLRAVVLRNFHGSRYLREHEQMYWIQRSMSEHRREQQLIQQTARESLPFLQNSTFTCDWNTARHQTPPKLWRLFEDEAKEARSSRQSSSLSRVLTLNYRIRGKNSVSTSTDSAVGGDVETVSAR